jgi:hypothetical protein
MVEAGYRIALSRAPSLEERSDALAFLEAQRSARSGMPEDQASLLACTDFCQVLMCLNEFMYVE